MQGEHGELQVVRGSRGLAGAPPLGGPAVGGGGAEGGGHGAEGAQVESGQVVHRLSQLGHALLHGAAVTCQGSKVSTLQLTLLCASVRVCRGTYNRSIHQRIWTRAADEEMKKQISKAVGGGAWHWGRGMRLGEGGHEVGGADLWGACLGEVGLVAQPLDGLGDGLGLHRVQGAAEVLHRLDHTLQRLVLRALDTGTAMQHLLQRNNIP